MASVRGGVLPTPPSPKSLLRQHGLRAKKHFGQNFLAQADLATRIATLATEPIGGTVVEIGAGLGALTAPLLERARRVVAIERDRDLIPALQACFATSVAAGNLILLEEDAKQVDYARWLAGPSPRCIAGNLPYQITGPLLERVTHLRNHVARAVFLVQLEVAHRLVALPATPEYGALSVFIQSQYAVRRAFVVRRGAFYPQPKVDSAVVVLDPLTTPVSIETPTFRAVVRDAFSQRRKTLRNSWRNLLGLPSATIEQAADRAAISLEVRGEVLAPADFARMAAEVDAC